MYCQIVFDYVLLNFRLSALTHLKEILNIYLLLDTIPIKYENNIANNVNITANKITNKGIIGNGSNQTTNKNTEINKTINEEKKECWIKKIFGKRS